MGQALRVVFWDQKHSETIHFRGIEKLDTRWFCAWLVEFCVLIARSPLRHNWIVCLILVVFDSFCITSHFCNNRKGKTGHKWSLMVFGFHLRENPSIQTPKKKCRDTVATPPPPTECPIQGRLLDWWKSTPGCHQGLNKLLGSLSNLRDLSSFVQRSQGLSYICEMSGALYIYPFFWIPFLQKHVFLQVFAIQIHGLWSLVKNSHNCSDSWQILHDTVHVFFTVSLSHLIQVSPHQLRRSPPGSQRSQLRSQPHWPHWPHWYRTRRCGIAFQFPAGFAAADRNPPGNFRSAAHTSPGKTGNNAQAALELSGVLHKKLT